MRIVFDSKVAGKKLKDMGADAKENLGILASKKKKGIQSFDSIKDDLEYLEVIADWNVLRVIRGDVLYIPPGFDKETVKMLRVEVQRKLNAQKAEGATDIHVV